MDNVTLIQRACQLEPEAVSQLYREHVQAIYRYTYYRVGNAQLAEDITAEVFLRAIEGLPSFESKGRPFRAWLYRIAQARVADHFRRARRAQMAPLEEDMLATNESPQRHIEQAQAMQRLLAAIQELTADQQQVIVLKFVEALSNAQVARLLGKTEGAVKSLQHRGLNALHRLLNRSDGSD